MAEKVKEIDLEASLSLEKSGKALFVWVLGAVNTKLVTDTLGIPESDLLVFYPAELSDAQNPQQFFDGRIPIFVCRHGNTSKVVAAKMMKKGIACYSLEGGITKYNPSLENVI